MDYKIWIVIPALNEESRIGRMLRGLPAMVPGFGSVTALVVDDGSKDATAEVAREAGARVVRHRINLGYGAALWTGSEAAVRSGADVIVHMDADGQHSADDLPGLLMPLLDGADGTVGLRPFRKPMPLVTRLGNYGLSLALRLLFEVEHADSQCGFRAFWARAWPQLRWQSRDYAISSEILARSRGRGVRWQSVPIRTIYLDPYKGTGIVDGMNIFLKLVRWRLSM